jgi:hypothetical protein
MELAGFIMHYRPGMHKSRVTKSFVVAVKVCGIAVWILLHVKFLVSRIVSWLLDSWKTCGPVI